MPVRVVPRNLWKCMSLWVGKTYRKHTHRVSKGYTNFNSVRFVHLEAPSRIKREESTNKMVQINENKES